MNELSDAVKRCDGAASAVLDLGDLSLGRFAHASYVAVSAIAWWLLSTPGPPTQVRFSTKAQQSILQRTGVVEACRVRSIPIVAPPELMTSSAQRLEGTDWSAFTRSPLPKNAALISDLASPLNRPPDPDEHGRRYQWVQPLIGAQRRMSRRDRDLAASDGARCLFEFVDNVHRWAQADRATAVVYRTRGGGPDSFDRLHVVVMDSGRGIIASVLDDPDARASMPGDLADNPTGLLLHFLKKAFGDREIPHHSGHGLHISQMLADVWIGRIDVLSSDHREPGLVHHARSTVHDGVEPCPSFTMPGIAGTLASITLNLVAPTADLREQIEHDELAERHEQPELFVATS